MAGGRCRRPTAMGSHEGGLGHRLWQRVRVRTGLRVRRVCGAVHRGRAVARGRHPRAQVWLRVGDREVGVAGPRRDRANDGVRQGDGEVGVPRGRRPPDGRDGGRESSSDAGVHARLRRGDVLAPGGSAAPRRGRVSREVIRVRRNLGTDLGLQLSRGPSVWDSEYAQRLCQENGGSLHTQVPRFRSES